MKLNSTLVFQLLMLFSVVCLDGCNLSTEAKKLNELALSYAGKNRDSLSTIAWRAHNSPDATLEDKALSQVLTTIPLGYAHKDSAIEVLRKAKIHLKGSKEKVGMTNAVLGQYYLMSGNNDSALIAYNAAEKALTADNDYLNSFKKGVFNGKGMIFSEQGNYEASLKYYKKTFALNVLPNCQDHAELAEIYTNLKQYEPALKHTRKSLRYADSVNSKIYVIVSLNLLSTLFEKTNQLDSAFQYNQKVIELIGENSPHAGEALFRSARYLDKKGRKGNAIAKYKSAIHLINRSRYGKIRPAHYYELGVCYSDINSDSALFFLRKAYHLSKEGKKSEQQKAAELLGDQFKPKVLDSALYYTQIAKELQEEIYDEGLANQLSKLHLEIETLEKEKALQEALSNEAKSTNQRNLIIVASSSFILTVLIGFFQFRRQSLIKNRLLEAEKSTLTSELERNQQLLSTQTLNMIHKNNGFSEIAENLEEVNGSGNKIKRIIDINMALEKDWNNFNLYFSQVHSGFYDKLSKEHPSLSVNDKRLCALVKMGLKNKEISSILNIKYESINMAKYRLKKKMDLENNMEINDYVGSF